MLNETRARKDRKGQTQVTGKVLGQARKYYQKLENTIRNRENEYELPCWKTFTESVAFKNLEHFLLKEHVIVKFEMDNNEKYAQNSNDPLGPLVKTYC